MPAAVRPSPDAAAQGQDGTGLRSLLLTWCPVPERADRWAGFLLAADSEAIRMWFGSDPGDKALRGAIDRDLVALDQIIGVQLDAILHHHRFQRLEAAWRGLHWLIEQAVGGPADRVVIRLMHAPWGEIARDLERAPELDQSHLFRLVYETEFGMAGGEPFGLLVIDHAVRHKPDWHYPTDDKAVLDYLAQVAALAFAPIVVSASPELVGVDGFDELAKVVRPAAPLADDDHRRWRSLADNPDSRFLAVTLPRVLGRLPWPDDGQRDDGFRYGETVTAVADRLWVNGGFAFAAVTARAAARFGWPGDVRGSDADRIGGGLVTNLPSEPHELSHSFSLPRLPLEVVFTDSQERAFVEAGLMPIGALPHGDHLLFSAVGSLYRPPRLAGPAGRAAFADSRAAAQINAVLCASRFAHYLKIRGRETIGELRRPEEIEAELRDWLMKFVNRNVLATSETRAAHPLYDAAVRVSEQPDRPGVFLCALDLQPYFQLDNVSAIFHFETKLARPGA